jgi:hypothetical protein
VQTCIVHLIRNSLEYANYKDRKTLAAALRPIYAAASEQAAQRALQEFADGPWGTKYPTIVDPGSALGSTSHRSSCFRQTSGGWSIRQTPSRA